MAIVNLIFASESDGIVAALKRYPAVFVVSDRKIASKITAPLVDRCARAGVAVKGVMDIRASERRKNLAAVEKIHRWLISCGADRDALVLAVGGGIVTDLAGFAACTYKRGVRYANVPTTLLAQTDAAIGGKTGCNIGGYKNMAGVIRQPQFTFVCHEYIRNLPRDIFTAGYAEMLKTFIIADPAAYEAAVNKADSGNLAALVRTAAGIKARIVEADEFETGQRKVLNLGHTFAHAIEYRSAHSLLHRGITHGHAVAMGIIMSARLSERLGIAKKGLADRLAADFVRVGLPVRCPWSEEQLQDIIRTDKKAEDGKVSYILIEDIGKVVIKKL